MATMTPPGVFRDNQEPHNFSRLSTPRLPPNHFFISNYGEQRNRSKNFFLKVRTKYIQRIDLIFIYIRGPGANIIMIRRFQQ